MPSPTLYAQQINATYRHLKPHDLSKNPSPISLNETRDPAKIYIAEDFLITNKKPSRRKFMGHAAPFLILLSLRTQHKNPVQHFFNLFCIQS